MNSARPLVVLRANWQCGLQDLPRQEARSSWETQSDAQSFRETGCNIVGYRVPGISLSLVPQQDKQRQHTVAKLIEMFESHQHKEQFLKDMSQTQKINRFSEASPKLQQDMDQTEIFELCENSVRTLWELCENSVKLRCPDCNSFTEIWSRTKAWWIWETNHGLEGERHAKKSKEWQERKPSDNTLTMESRRRLPKNVGIYRYWRRRNQDVRPNCCWRTTTTLLRKLKEHNIQNVGFSR